MQRIRRNPPRARRPGECALPDAPQRLSQPPYRTRETAAGTANRAGMAHV